jgi:glycerophosphoryl diester phosphodiesterase
MNGTLSQHKQLLPDFNLSTYIQLILLPLSIYACLIASVYANETDLKNKIIIAHRGASGYLPEHTLASKVMAYGLGADYLEQDVILSKDSVPIVLHDLELDAVTNVSEVYPDRARNDGKFYALDFSLDELKQLRVTERKNSDGKPRYPGRFPATGSDFRIATLEEEIQLIQGLNKSTGKNIGLYTEIKSPAWHKNQGYDLTHSVLETLGRYGYRDESANIYIQCFDPAELIRIHSDLKSNLKLVQLIGENAWNEADTDYNFMRTVDGLVKIAGYASGIGPSIDHILDAKEGKVRITPLVGEAHKLGLLVHPYTLRNDALPGYVSGFDELLELLFIKAEVDGVFTDFSDLAVQFKMRKIP